MKLSPSRGEAFPFTLLGTFDFDWVMAALEFGRSAGALLLGGLFASLYVFHLTSSHVKYCIDNFKDSPAL